MNNQKYLGKFKVQKITKDQGLAAQIYEGFGRKVAFPRIIGIIARIGSQAAYEAWNESNQKSVSNPVSLFLYKTSQIQKQIKWDDEAA